MNQKRSSSHAGKMGESERFTSVKSILYYWSLTLNAIILALLAVTMYGIFTNSSLRNGRGGGLPSARDQQRRPLVGGLIHGRLTGSTRQHEHGDIAVLSEQHGMGVSTGGDGKRAGDGRHENSNEWKKLLENAILDKMDKPQQRHESRASQAQTRPATEDQDCKHNPSSKCTMCAGVGSSCCHDSERKEVFLAIMCKSAPLNAKRRQAVRLVWDQMIMYDHFYAAYVLDAQVYFAFVLGKVHTKNLEQDKIINEGIQGEASIYEDMVVGEFHDSYTNLTNKLLFTLDWLRANLRFRYLMMADDDTFVNVFGVLQWLVISPETGFYAGKLEKDVLVVRDPESKWYVDRGFYGPETYPPYHQGFGYVLSCDAVEEALGFVSGIPLFGIDDTVMGMLMYVSGVKPTNMPRFFAAPYYCQMAEAEHPLVIGDVELDGFVRYMRDILYIGCPVCQKKSASESAPSKT